MIKRSLCTDLLYNSTNQRKVIAEMSDERLIEKYFYEVNLIQEYAKSLTQINLDFLSKEAFFHPIWIRTAANEIRFILDELNYRSERDFSPYLQQTLNEILNSSHEN